MISFNCPGCSKPFKVKDDLAGRKTKCPGCGTSFEVPAGSAQKQPTNADEMTFAEDKFSNGVPNSTNTVSRMGVLFSYLFDFRFRHYLTPYIIRITWVMALLGASLFLISSTFIVPFLSSEKHTSFEANETRGFDRGVMKTKPEAKEVTEPSGLSKAFGEIMSWILSSGLRLIGVVIVLMYIRVLAEMTIVVFNISNDLKSLTHKQTNTAPIFDAPVS